MKESNHEDIYSDEEMRKLAVCEKKMENKVVTPRIRQYYDGHKGPFKVFVRKINRDIKYFELNKVLRNKYKSIVDVYLSNKNKISVTFLSREEANKMPFNEDLNKVYKVYIPEAFVEVMACITYSIEENENDILKYGEGKFINSQIKNVKIIEVLRFQKESQNQENDKCPTTVVRVHSQD